MQVARITVPQWLQGTDMYYRLKYRHDGHVAAYGRSDWVAPPAMLLERIVQGTISTGGTWRAVIGPGDPARSDVSLQIRLDDFSQVFMRPRQSAGVLDATVTLIDNQKNSVIAQKHFHVRSAAPSSDAEGGVKALGHASRQFAVRLQRWLRTTAQSPTPRTRARSR